MPDTTIKKVDSTHSPKGEMGQKYLVSGVSISLRLWENVSPNQEKETSSRPYETAGYVISGRARLHLHDQVMTLEPGDSWIVPKHTEHTYTILENFTAVEATHPPARIEDRDHTGSG